MSAISECNDSADESSSSTDVSAKRVNTTKTFVDCKRKELQKKPEKRRKARSFNAEFTEAIGNSTDNGRSIAKEG